jgi:hypothetical protein
MNSPRSADAIACLIPAICHSFEAMGSMRDFIAAD